MSVNQQTRLSDEEHSLKWRLECLEKAGIPKKYATRLAESDADLHKMLDAWRYGCEINLLVKIFDV